MKRMLEKANYVKEKSRNINWTIFILATALSILGVLSILSASANLTIKNRKTTYYYAISQASMAVIGIIVMFVLSILNLKGMRKRSVFWWILTIILLFATLFSPLAVVYNGHAKRGLDLGVKFMPSDLYKISSILFFSNFLLLNKKNKGHIVKDLVLTLSLIIAPLVLIYKQPDLSTTIVIGASLFTIYALTGFQKKFILPLIAFAAAGLILLQLFGVNIYGYQEQRIWGWLNPEKYGANGGSAWQILNSLYAVSRGGLLGVGYGKSVLKFGYLADEVHNDMIFSVMAEEFGLIGTIIFVSAIFFLFFLIIKEAIKAKDLYSKYVLIGFASIYLYQSIINVGVAINLLPNTGITLPFISYGRTSLITYFIIMGLVLNLSRANRESDEKRMGDLSED